MTTNNKNTSPVEPGADGASSDPKNIAASKKKEPVVKGVSQKDHDALSARFEKQSKQLADLVKDFAALKTEKLAAGTGKDASPKKPEIPKKPLKHNGKEYMWKVAAVTLKGRGKVTAEEASTDKAIIDEILKIPGQGILVEQE